MFLLSRFSSSEIHASATNTAQRWSGLRRLMHTRHSQRALLAAAVLGGGIGLSYGLVLGLSYGLVLGLIAGLVGGLRYGLLFGLIGELVSLVLGAQAGDVHLTEHLRWTWGSLIRSLLTPRHLRSAVLFASIVLVLIGLNYGLFFGLSAGLSYWLLLGLIQGISHERIEDQDRRVFNQGMRQDHRQVYTPGTNGP